MRSNLVVIKVDTTGLFNDSVPDEVLSVAIIDGEGTALLDTLIKPELHADWPEAMEVNGITPGMVSDAPAFAEVAPEIRRILDGADSVMGWNLSFELRAIRCATKMAGHVEPWACSCVCGEHNRARDLIEEFADLRESEFYLPLTDALRLFHVDVDDPVGDETRALTIARATLKVARAMDDSDYRRMLFERWVEHRRKEADDDNTCRD